MKIFFGACISLISVIYKGITLYKELTPQELEEGSDSEALYLMRILVLIILFSFTAYLFISLLCLVK